MRRLITAGFAVLATTLAPALLTTSTAAATEPVPASSMVVEHGHLALAQGSSVTPYDFTGINAYSLTSAWGTNWGCGWGAWTAPSLDTFFASLAPDEVVRTWFFQQFATRITGSGSVRDWTALDRVVAEADKYHIHLVATLGNQDGTCDDGHWKDAAWYAGGFNTVENEGFSQNGTAVNTTTTSYSQWVHDVVSRYGGNSAIAMWEPVNEPQALNCSASGSACWGAPWGSAKGCPNESSANNAMRSFFDNIGGVIHTVAPGSLVSDGSLGSGSCGEATLSDFDNIIASPGIDVVGYHDYTGYSTPSDLGARTQAAAALGKPMMVGESGVTGCGSAITRASIYQSKIASAFNLGVSAYLAWWYGGDGGQPTCDSPIDVDSPTWGVLASAAHSTGPAEAAAVAPPAPAVIVTSPTQVNGTIPSASPSPLPSPPVAVKAPPVAARPVIRTVLLPGIRRAPRAHVAPLRGSLKR